MDQSTSIRCTIGWHRWHVAAEEGMRVRICTDCGRRRHHGPQISTKDSPATNWGLNYTGGGGFGGEGG
ncbi:hypothetical protein LL946_03715 [Knoellia locipacati]|uniref:hypothetical protein n=1 Tax=Knoellia locipacati TaxID=882824 RepID=UPI0038507DD5